jgi:Lon protease-like protein
MAKTITVDFTRPVPLFPLGNTVLLPHAVQGLHVFEPRYRQMVDACLSEMKGGSLLTARPIAPAVDLRPKEQWPSQGALVPLVHKSF